MKHYRVILHSVILHIKITAMKKLIFLFTAFTTVSAFSQKSKWTISLSASPGFGGPQNSIVKTMTEQGFGETLNYDFLGLTGSIDYPKTERGGSYLIRVATRQKANRSLFFIAGISNQGTVSGYHYEGTDPMLGFSMGSYPRVKYQVFQFTGGYQFDLKNSWAKFSIGPSVFLYNYGLEMATNTERKTSVVPGGNVNCRLPLGKQKRTFGIELFADGNIAPKAKMSDMQETSTSTPLNASKVNMMHATAGILLTFRG